MLHKMILLHSRDAFITMKTRVHAPQRIFISPEPGEF